jgi:hypothetical protein
MRPYRFTVFGSLLAVTILGVLTLPACADVEMEEELGMADNRTPLGGGGNAWTRNEDAVQAASDTGINPRPRSIPEQGVGINAYVVDHLRTTANIGNGSGHYDLQVSIIHDLVALRARVTGTTVCFNLRCGTELSAAERAVREARSPGVISWVEPMGELAVEDLLTVLEKLKAWAGPGKVVVTGVGVFSGAQLADARVQEALTAGGIVVVDCPQRGSEYASPPTHGGQSPTDRGSGAAITASLPTKHGWCSIAVPLVAGTAALMLEANPQLSSQDVARLLSSTTNFTGTTRTGDGTAVPLFTVPEALAAVH